MIQIKADLSDADRNNRGRELYKLSNNCALSVAKCIIYLFQTFFDSSFISSSVIHLSPWPPANVCTVCIAFPRPNIILQPDSATGSRLNFPTERTHSYTLSSTKKIWLEQKAATSEVLRYRIFGRMRLPLSIIFAIHYLKLLTVFWLISLSRLHLECSLEKVSGLPGFLLDLPPFIANA